MSLKAAAEHGLASSIPYDHRWLVTPRDMLGCQKNPSLLPFVRIEFPKQVPKVQDKSGQVYFLGLAPTLESIQYLNFTMGI